MAGRGLAAPPPLAFIFFNQAWGLQRMGGLAWGPSRAAGSSWVNASGAWEQPLGGFSGIQGGRRRARGEKETPEESLWQLPPQLGLSLRVPFGFGDYDLDMPGPQPSAASRTTGAVACLAEVLLWVGGSVVVSPRWQLSLLGKKGQNPGPSWGLAKPYGAIGCTAS